MELVDEDEHVRATAPLQPVQLRAQEGIRRGAHSVALSTDGNAYAWGNNVHGQLGDETITSRTVPVPVPVKMPDGVTFTQVDSGALHSVARAADGTAYAWGSDAYGQLGSITTSQSISRVQAPAGVTFTQVNANERHTVARAADGTAYAWGDNRSGQLGAGTMKSSPVPVPVPTLIRVTGALFGGTSGTGLVKTGDGAWAVTAPPHAAGPVDVVVSWALNDVPQPDIIHADAFTYIVADVSPTITDPADQTVTAGDTAVFTVEANGTPTPTIAWEISTDDGATWVTASPTDATVSGDGKTLTVAAAHALTGTRYRATAENSAGTATSGAATLTVSAAPVSPAPPVTEDEGDTGGVDDGGVNDGGVNDGGVNDGAVSEGAVGEKDLAHTGGHAAPPIAAALLIMLAGAGLVFASRRRNA